MPTQKRQNLVCVRLSGGSVFEKWFRRGRPRTWDLLLSYYSHSAPGPIPPAEVVSIGGLSKFTSIKDIFHHDRGIFDQYRFIWFLDDDIKLQFDDVDMFFGQMSQFNMGLAQPALSADSFMSWPITQADPECIARYTNFVEIMMPAFAQDAFRLCIDTFDKSVSGWGLDFIWPKILASAGKNIGIVDNVIAKHTRKIDVRDGRFYTYLNELGIDPAAEAAALRTEFAIPADYSPEVLGRVAKPPINGPLRRRVLHTEFALRGWLRALRSAHRPV